MKTTAVEWLEDNIHSDTTYNEINVLIEQAKWLQKRMYSEEEVFNLLMEFSLRDRNSSSETPHSIAKWLEQFKKK